MPMFALLHCFSPMELLLHLNHKQFNHPHYSLVVSTIGQILTAKLIGLVDEIKQLTPSQLI